MKKELWDEIRAAITEIIDKNDLELLKIEKTENGDTFKAEIEIKRKVNIVDSQAFILNFKHHGIDGDYLNGIIKLPGGDFKILGYSPNHGETSIKLDQHGDIHWASPSIVRNSIDTFGIEREFKDDVESDYVIVHYRRDENYIGRIYRTKKTKVMVEFTNGSREGFLFRSVRGLAKEEDYLEEAFSDSEINKYKIGEYISP